MSPNHRRENRVLRVTACCIKWNDSRGITYSAKATILNESPCGLALDCAVPLPKDTAVYIQAHSGYPRGYAIVRHCTQNTAGVILGLELQTVAQNGYAAGLYDAAKDYYEVLQIGPNEQGEIIQRVYLASISSSGYSLQELPGECP